MKRLKFSKSILMLAVFFLSLVSGFWEASADEEVYWEFSVPLQLTELMSQVKNVSVLAYVYDKNNKLVAKGFWGENAPADGNLNKTFVIKAKSYGGGDIFTGVKYTIALRLSDLKTDVVPNTQGYPWAKSKPKTTLVAEIKGNLP